MTELYDWQESSQDAADPHYINREPQRCTEVRSGENNALWAVRLMGEQTEPESAVVVLYPAATDDEEFMRSQLSLLQHGLAKPRQILGIPYYAHEANNTPIDDSYLLIGGRLEPYCRKIADLIESQFIKEVDIVGLEQGASLGIVLAEVLRTTGKVAVRSATLIEPLNMIKRTREDLIEILKNFPSTRALKKVLDQYGLRNLRHDFPQTPTFPVRHSRPRDRALAEWRIAQDDPVYQILLKGLAWGSFPEDLENSSKAYPKVIARGEHSEVCPTFESIEPRSDFILRQMLGMGRELTYSPIHITELVQKAISVART